MLSQILMEDVGQMYHFEKHVGLKRNRAAHRPAPDVRAPGSRLRQGECVTFPWGCPQDQHMGSMAWPWAEGGAELCCGHREASQSQGICEAEMAPQSCLTLRPGGQCSYPSSLGCLRNRTHDLG